MATFTLLRDLVLSVRDKSEGRPQAIGFLDLGLTPEQRDWLTVQGCLLVAPDWDVAFPDMGSRPEWLKAMVSRPFLPRHFPGFATYAWLDADIWLQDFQALADYFTVAQSNPDAVAITLELERAYYYHFVDVSHPEKERHRLAYSVFYGEDTGGAACGFADCQCGRFCGPSGLSGVGVLAAGVGGKLAKIKFALC